MELKIYKDKNEVAEAFSSFFSKQVNGSNEFHVALSGGSTPKIVFDVLAREFGASIDWRKVHFYWGDERCVAPSDDQSNYKMTVDHLFSKIEVPEGNIHRIKGENAPKDEADRYAGVLETNLPKSNGLPQFDLVILGMGDDGHTASIFPHELDLWHSEKLCEVAVHPDSGQKRVTITGSVINNAETVAFLVTGGGKAEKVAEILGQKGGYREYPANLVAPKSGKLLWFLDEPAAALTTSGQS
ncbi:6-phosphogluconolactonase [Pseudozobellia thermophila]|uniref:6-phosphogluconolactonase n=1 Tax=Pseudozobellia thermophila TaxID=192903 RepID=A0A1M6FGR5_9FLAO|nr:6-phosphogluconolactonase [Pseudozobellia thermophila]SHI96847.1 6-phosphogluconolactonase [Pseudozobellia thermophila]